MTNVERHLALASFGPAMLVSMGMREKRKRPVHIANLLSKTAHRFKFHEKMIVYRIWDRWEKVAGPEIAAHSQPVNLFKGKIVIRVEHPTWMQELSYLKFQLLERLKETFPEVKFKDMCFVLGKLDADGKGTPRRIRRALCEDEKEFIEQAVGEIADPDIRDAARKAMTKGFEIKDT